MADPELGTAASAAAKAATAAQARGGPFGRPPKLCGRINAPALAISLKKENPSAKSPGPSMSMSQRSIAAYTTRRPYDSTPFRSHARSNLATVPLLIIDVLSMRNLPPTAAKELLEIVMRRYERTSTLLITSSRPVEDWGQLLGDSAAVTAMLDRLLHHGHILKVRPTELPD